jgi:hypothetical protein
MNQSPSNNIGLTGPVDIPGFYYSIGATGFYTSIAVTGPIGVSGHFGVSSPIGLSGPTYTTKHIWVFGTPGHTGTISSTGFYIQPNDTNK